MKRRYTTTDGQVISLMCARFEDALAEGRTDAIVTEHAAECVRCHMMLKQIQGEQGAIASIAMASGPVSLPSGFTEGVLARALPPERYLKDTAEPARRFKWWHHAITGLVAGVCTALIFWAGGDAKEMMESDKANQAIAVQNANDEGSSTFSFGIGVETESTESDTVSLIQLEKLFGDDSKVLPAVSVPEASVDLPKELRLAILRQVEGNKTCPKRMKKPVRITLTVGKDGGLSNRTVFSVANQSIAHDCVNQALDALTLPPMEESANITLDVVW